MTNYPKGSEWRKWDLHVQTILDDGYVSIDTYSEYLKNEYPEQWQKLCDKIGSEELIKKYDSKPYFFTDPNDDVKTRSKNYAKLLLNYIEMFNEDTGVICLTDHNYHHEYLLDSLIMESNNFKTKVIPGVEINVLGVHMLVLFGKRPYQKQNYSEGIKTFLSKININNAKTNGTLTVSDKSYTNVIDEINNIGAIFIYPHCNSSNGLFQERGKTDRTHLADQFNYKSFNILQSQNKSSVDSTISFINTKDTLKSNYVFTLGSDARSLRNILQGDNTGCFCWIKSDPTFEGLKQIIYEPESRVFIGAKPKILERVKNYKRRYIKSLNIKWKNGYDGTKGIWFNNNIIEFNKELIAIIGNKGSGKSAITDILGLLGNAKVEKNHLTFLHEKKFKKNGLAKNFKANLVWENDESNEENLNADIDKTSNERLKYIPQNYFEILCNEQEEKFKKELEKVIFTHLDEADKENQDSFEELVNYKSQIIEEEIQKLKNDIENINSQIINLEEKGNQSYKKTIENKLEQKKKDLAEIKNVLKKLKENEIGDPNKDKELQEVQQNILKKLEISEKAKAIIEGRKEKYKGWKKELNQRKTEIEQFKRKIEGIEKEIKEFKEKNKEKFLSYGLDVDQIIQYKFKYELIEGIEGRVIKVLNKLSDYLLERHDDLGEEKRNKNLNFKLNKVEEEIEKLNKKVDEPTQKYNKYLKNLRSQEKERNEIMGKEDIPDTIKSYEKELDYLKENLENDLVTKRKERLEKSMQIYDKKLEIIEIYNKIKSPVDKFIKENTELIKNYNITIEVSFILDSQFEEDFLAYINQRNAGTFLGKEPGRDKLRKIIKEKDLNDKNDIQKILDLIIEYLEIDKRENIKHSDRQRLIISQINEGKLLDFYNYVFGLKYLKPNYELKLDKKKLEQLSPGERGSLLLVFYLMLDQNVIPLVIDQPEDNLDNKSVSTILVPFLKKAKKRRQIIMVTHNPNLAVFADAEQIVHTNIDKENKYKVEIVSGAIENPDINKRIVDILEGTMPAFDNRRLKYVGRSL